MQIITTDVHTYILKTRQLRSSSYQLTSKKPTKLLKPIYITR